jgi:hypothetical protein
MVAIELDFPSKLFKLRDNTGLDNTNRAFIDTCFGLHTVRLSFHSALLLSIKQISHLSTTEEVK